MERFFVATSFLFYSQFSFVLLQQLRHKRGHLTFFFRSDTFYRHRQYVQILHILNQRLILYLQGCS